MYTYKVCSTSSAWWLLWHLSMYNISVGAKQSWEYMNNMSTKSHQKDNIKKWSTKYHRIKYLLDPWKWYRAFQATHLILRILRKQFQISQQPGSAWVPCAKASKVWLNMTEHKINYSKLKQHCWWKKYSTSWYGKYPIYKSFIHPRWLFGISSINSMSPV